MKNKTKDRAILEVLEEVEVELIKALQSEARYSRRHGFKEGHYWLHRRIGDVIGLAIQDVEDRLQDEKQEPKKT